MLDNVSLKVIENEAANGSLIRPQDVLLLCAQIRALEAVILSAHNALEFSGVPQEHNGRQRSLAERITELSGQLQIATEQMEALADKYWHYILALEARLRLPVDAPAEQVAAADDAIARRRALMEGR